MKKLFKNLTIAEKFILLGLGAIILFITLMILLWGVKEEPFVVVVPKKEVFRPDPNKKMVSTGDTNNQCVDRNLDPYKLLLESGSASK